jgi:photosystem II stability/assembly factor-like uncharacterized protein
METPEPSRHGRRALPLIAGSLAAMVVAGLIYLHPAFPSLPKGPAAPLPPIPSTVPAGYFPQYDFISATTGWALLVGTSASTPFYVYRTTDGAKHWNLQFSADAAGAGFGEIKFFDSKRGMIWIGSPIQLYRTSDAGTHWDPVSLPSSQATEVTFSDPSHIWLLASQPDPGLLRHFFATIDGGSTWTELALPKGVAWANNGGISHVQFRRPGEGWLAAAGASGPTVYSTVDGGASWEPHDLPRPAGADVAIESFVGLLPGVGVIAYTDYSLDYGSGATKSFAYTSFDDGTTWRLVTPPADAPVWNLTFQDSSHWWVTYLGTVWKSSDTGQTWKIVYQRLDNLVYQPQFIDVRHGWAELVTLTAVGPPDGLAMTSDAGLNWTQVNAPGPS